MDSTTPELAEPEIVLATVLHLMTQHARSRSPLIARVVARQLGYLARHPSDQLPSFLQAVCGNLEPRWQRIAVDDSARAFPVWEEEVKSSILH